MKKINFAILFALLTLASCASTTNENVENIADENNSGDINTEVNTGEISDEELNSNIEVNEVSTSGINSGETINDGSEASMAIERINFNLPYTNPAGVNVALDGYIEIENGVIVSVGGMEKAQGPQVNFAQGVGEKVIGKEINGLQIDTISGASLTTAAFNKFLKDNYN